MPTRGAGRKRNPGSDGASLKTPFPRGKSVARSLRPRSLLSAFGVNGGVLATDLDDRGRRRLTPPRWRPGLAVVQRGTRSWLEARHSRWPHTGRALRRRRQSRSRRLASSLALYRISALRGRDGRAVFLHAARWLRGRSIVVPAAAPGKTTLVANWFRRARTTRRYSVLDKTGSAPVRGPCRSDRATGLGARRCSPEPRGTRGRRTVPPGWSSSANSAAVPDGRLVACLRVTAYWPC